jgi:hypothetical protein
MPSIVEQLFSEWSRLRGAEVTLAVTSLRKRDGCNDSKIHAQSVMTGTRDKPSVIREYALNLRL